MIVAYAAAFLLLAGQPAARCKLEIATVHDLAGTWKDSAYNNRALVKKSTICDDSRIERVLDSSASARDFITLARRSDAKQTLTFECRLHLGCEAPLDLGPLAREESRQLRGAGIFESYYAYVVSRSSTLSRDPRSSRATRSAPEAARSAGPALTTEATVVLAGQGLRSDAIFAGQAAGRYRLRRCSNDESADDCRQSVGKGTIVDWQPSSPSALPFTLPAGVTVFYRAPAAEPAANSVRVIAVAADPSTKPESIREGQDKIALATAMARSEGSGSEALESYVRFLAGTLTAPPGR